MKKIIFLIVVAAFAGIVTSGCGNNSSLKFKTSEVTDVVKHPEITDKETSEIIPDLYADLPDKDFPIPMTDGNIVPYDWMRPSEEYDITTSYGYTGRNLMQSYQGQLREAGFLDNGNVGRVESLWISERSEDGATLVVELGYNRDEATTVISMYVNYLNRNEQVTIRPQQLSERDFPGDIGYQGDLVAVWIADVRRVSHNGASNVSVATDIDAAAFNAWYMAEIAKIKR